MARVYVLAHLATSVLVLLGGGQAFASPTVSDDKLHTSMIRRHGSKDTSEVHMGPSGEMVLLEAKQDPAGDFCNHDYNLGTPNSNTCTKGVQITRPEDCVHAANTLPGHTAAPAPNFTINTGWRNPQPFPKNCFALNGQIFFNPTEGEPSAWEGTPICERELYPDGTPNTDSSGACPTDFEAITTWSECQAAFACTEGNAGCQMPDFENAAIYTTESAPKGCFREANGCFNFNHKSSAPSGTIQGISVCKKSR